MLQTWKPDFWTQLYVYSLCLLVYAAADVSWLFAVPRQPLYILVAVLSIFKAATSGWYSSPKKIAWILGWFLFNLLIILFSNNPLISHLFRLVFFLIMTSVLLLSIDEMKYLLKILINFFVVILIISIPAWLLYLTGVPMPHTGPHYHSNDFHVYYDYYFFTTQVSVSLLDYSRFSSVFLEPGQMATPCLFLFHLNSRENKLFQFKNVILMIGILLSLSLIAYGLFIFSLVINRMGNRRFRIPAIVLTLLLIVGFGQYFISNEDNAVNALIVSRLEYDEETTIAGYNRTNDYFEARYAELMRSNERYFGIHDQSTRSWTSNTSGYKKFIVHYGTVGFSIIIGLMLILLLDNKKRASLMYGIMVVVAFLVRDMLTTPLWMTCAIIGMYIMGEDIDTEKNPNQIVVVNT